MNSKKEEKEKYKISKYVTVSIRMQVSPAFWVCTPPFHFYQRSTLVS